MNTTLTLSQLITRLATSTGVDNNTARRFLRIFFATIEDALADGQTISIKGIGTFKSIATELYSDKLTVSFVPDEAIATELNRPFEMFNAVVLANDITFEEQISKEHTEDTPTITIAEVSDKPEAIKEMSQGISEPTDNTFEKKRNILWPEEEMEIDETTTEVPIQNIPEPKATIAEISEPNQIKYTEHHTTDNNESKKLWIWIALTLVGVCAIAYLAAVFTTPVDPRPNEDSLEELEIQSIDTQIEEVPVEKAAITEITEQPLQESTPITELTKETQSTTEKEPVYDNVEISLIRLAKKHYGDGTYWVFIYEANSDIISNPNRIRPGQRVLIPDRSTFPGNSASETRAIAKKKQSDILDRFK